MMAVIRASTAWLSVHMPFVWRTRLLLYALIAGMASASFAIIPRGKVTTTAEAPTLSAVELDANIWTFLTMGFVALFCFDVARRTGSVFTAGHRVRLCLCVAVSVVAIQLPQFLFFRSAIPRLARLETEPNIDVLLKRHGKYGFWRCMPQPFEVPASLAEDVQRDLFRYGLHTRLMVEEAWPSQHCGDRPDFQVDPTRRAWSLVAWPLKTSEPKERELHFAFTDHGGVFEGRLRSLKAAHQSLRAEGPYAAVVGIRRPLAVAALASILTTLFVSMPLARARAFANRRRFTVPLRGQLRVPYDEWIARRWPMLWASRVAVAPLSLLPVPLAFYWNALRDGGSTTFLPIAVFAFAVLILLGTQRGARYISGTTKQEAIVLVVHTVALLAVFILAYAVLMNGYLERFWDDMGFSAAVMGTIFFCAGLQAARIGSIYTAFGAIGLLFLSVYPSAFVNSFGVPMIAAVLLTPAATLVVVVLYARTRPVRPMVQRVLLGALFLYAAVLWVALVMERLVGVTSDISLNLFAAAVLVGALCSFIVILRITENLRRSLAHSPN
jgi:hypothetical protein